MKTSSLILALLFVVSAFSSVEAEKKSKRIPQYKKNNRDRITALAEGKIDTAISYFEKYLKQHPDDLEAKYGLAIGYAKQGNKKKSNAMIEASLAGGLPLGRYLAGPRELTKDLDLSTLDTKAAQIIHGPLLGNVTDTSASCWVRTAEETEVTVVIHPERKTDAAKKSRNQTSAKNDYTTVIQIEDLEPDTAYTYWVMVKDSVKLGPYTFKTMPRSGKPAKFPIVFGGGAGFTPIYESMWNVIAEHKPRALFLLGDCVYIDTPFVRATQQYCYYRRQSRPEFRGLVSQTSVSAIWDDHDFYTNDGSGMAKHDPAWKVPVWETFRNNWNNPAYGFGTKQLGCWFKQSIADVDFFFLDGRYYRDPAKAVMLGEVQQKWLLDGLKASKATFKVLCSNVPMTPGVKPGSKDTWDGYPEEREEIFSFIHKNNIEGFFVIAADRHRSDAWKIERSDGYAFYELQSSRLTNIHTHKLIDGCLFGYNQKCSFGRLTFDTTKDDPEVTYDVINIDNKVVQSLTITKSELRKTND